MTFPPLRGSESRRESVSVRVAALLGRPGGEVSYRVDRAPSLSPAPHPPVRLSPALFVCPTLYPLCLLFSPLRAI